MFTETSETISRKRWTWQDERIDPDEPAYNGNGLAVCFGVAAALVVVLICIFS